MTETNENQNDLQEPIENNAAAYIERGIAYGSKSDYDRAISDFDKAIELDQNNTKAYIGRGKAYRFKKDYDRAIADFDKTIELDKNNAGAYIGRGKAYRFKKNYNHAIADFDKAIELDQNNAGAYIGRGIAYRLKKKYDRAIADFDKAIELDKNNAGAYIGRGIAYRLKKKYDRAIADFDKAIEPDKNNAEAYIGRGIAYRLKKKYDRAIADFDKAIEPDKNNAGAYIERGIAYRLKKKYDRAIADFDKAIELDQNNAGAYIGRGKAYRFKKDYNRAIDDFDKAIELNRNNAEAYIERGITYGFKKDYNRTIADFDKAIELDKNNTGAYIWRGKAYRFNKNYDRAIADFDKAVELDKNNVEAYIGRGIAYRFKGDYEFAIAAFKKAIDLDINNARVYRARAYRERGRTYILKHNNDLAITDIAIMDLAIADFDKALDTDSNDTISYMEKGYAYYFKGDYGYSLDNFLEYDKHDSSAKFNNVLIYIAFHIKDIQENRGEIFKSFHDLFLIIQKIKNRLFYKPKNNRGIAHYTSFYTLKNLVREEGCLRIYNAAYMNDPEEGEVFSTLMKERYAINLKGAFYPDSTSYISPAYIGSFVSVGLKEEQKDKLFLWRIYGKHDSKEAEGACLIFKHNKDFFARRPRTIIEAMRQQRDMESRQRPIKLELYKIAYKSQVNKKWENDLATLAELLSNIQDYPSNSNLSKLVRELLDEIRFLFKEDHYKEEKEVRVVRICYFKEENEQPKGHEIKIEPEKISPGFEEENEQPKGDEIEIDTEQIPPRFYLETDKSLHFHEVILGPNAKHLSEWKKWLKKQRKSLVIKQSKAKYRNS